MKKQYVYAIYETLNNNPNYEIPLIISDYLLDILNYLNGIIKIDSKHISKYMNKNKLIKINDKISYKLFKIDLVED